MEQLSKQMALIERERFEPNVAREQEWEREPDPTTLWAGAQTLFSQEALRTLVASHVETAGFGLEAIGSSVHIMGDPRGLAKRWKISFSGSGTQSLHAQRAKKFMALIKNSDGSYKDMCAQSPGGDRIKVYFNYDKSPPQSQLENGSKKF